MSLTPRNFNMAPPTLCGRVSIRGGVERCAADIGGGLSVASEGDETPARSFASGCSLPLPAKSFEASSEFLRRRANVRLRPLLTVVLSFAGVDGGGAQEVGAAVGAGLLWLRPICKLKGREAERLPAVATRCWCCWAAEEDERAG